MRQHSPNFWLPFLVTLSIWTAGWQGYPCRHVCVKRQNRYYLRYTVILRPNCANFPETSMTTYSLGFYGDFLSMTNYWLSLLHWPLQSAVYLLYRSPPPPSSYINNSMTRVLSQLCAFSKKITSSVHALLPCIVNCISFLQLSCSERLCEGTGQTLNKDDSCDSTLAI